MSVSQKARSRIRKIVFYAFMPLFCWLILSIQLEYPYPQNYFRLPIPEDRELLLAGTFGELRPNHFHAGIDIKTLGATGTPMVATANGWVSRIKVNSYGYGKTLYIDHPNGYTTVYAHLDGYAPKIDAFIKKLQVQTESWELEVFPGKQELPVKKGEVVAVSGNTGASRAPHLHFEIRDAKTQTPIDPLLFGYTIQDNIHPRIYGLMLYPMGDESMVRIVYENGKSKTSTVEPIKARISGSNGKYSLRYVKRIEAFGKVGFAVKTYDYHNGSHNKLGVPLITLKGDGKVFFKQDLEKIPFSDTRYLNALIDYELKARYGSYYNRAFVLPGNDLKVYPKLENGGLIELREDTTLEMEMHLEDRAGNFSDLLFTLKGLKNYNFTSSTISSGSDKRFKYNEVNTYETDEIKIKFLNNSFYEDLSFQYTQDAMPSFAYSYRHDVHNGLTPVHKYFTISIKAHGLPERYRDKAVVVRNGRMEGGYYEDGWITTRARYFGDFYIKVDSTAPVVYPTNFNNGYNLKWRSYITLRMSDNLSGIQSFKAWLDGKFIPLDYEYKYSQLRYDFEEEPSGDEHIFKITVMDKVGNKTTRTINFIR